jgi:hypothetical protein
MYASLHCSTKDTYYNAFMWLNDSLTRCTSTFDVATVRAAAVLAFNAENRRLKKPPPDSTPASVLGFAAAVGPRRSSTVSGSHTAGPGCCKCPIHCKLPDGTFRVVCARNTDAAANAKFKRVSLQEPMALSRWLAAAHVVPSAGKHRLVVDHHDLNAACHAATCRYESIEDLVQLLTQKSWLFSCDLVSAYHCNVAQQHSKYTGFHLALPARRPHCELIPLQHGGYYVFPSDLQPQEQARIHSALIDYHSSRSSNRSASYNSSVPRHRSSEEPAATPLVPLPLDARTHTGRSPSTKWWNCAHTHSISVLGRALSSSPSTCGLSSNTCNTTWSS